MSFVCMVPQLGDMGWRVGGFGMTESPGTSTTCHRGPLHGSWGGRREGMVLGVTGKME